MTAQQEMSIVIINAPRNLIHHVEVQSRENIIKTTTFILIFRILLLLKDFSFICRAALTPISIKLLVTFKCKKVKSVTYIHTCT